MSNQPHELVKAEGCLPVRRPNIRKTGLRLVVCVAILCSVTAYACQVPVFRYALERWMADRYRVVVLHDKPLNESQLTTLLKLKEASEPQSGGFVGMDVQLIDVTADKDKLNSQMEKSWRERSDKSAALLLSTYPAANKIDHELPAWTGEFTKDSVARFVDSPVRQELAKRLQRGDSAVWIFVPSGKDDADNAARQRLKKQLAEDEKWLEIPTPEELEVTSDVLENVKVPLQIRFSVLELKRDDPAEQFLLASLMNSEDDLKSFDQPLTFPVFGRGRVLYALVGKGIAASTIRTASSFIAGPCSCQVKNQNPGFDLLLRSNWKQALGDVLISEPIESIDTEANAPKLLTIPPGRKSSSSRRAK